MISNTFVITYMIAHQKPDKPTETLLLVVVAFIPFGALFYDQQVQAQSQKHGKQINIFQPHFMTTVPTNAVSPASFAFKLSRRKLSLMLVSLGLGFTLAACSESAVSVDAVSLDSARTELTAGRAVLIDIREPSEHATGVAPGAQLLPMRQLNTRLAEIPTAADKPVLLICNTQNRSSATLKTLHERGYTHVRFVQGGMSEWNRRGWPVVKPVSPG